MRKTSRQASPAIGDRVEPFRITAELGRGGMGVVYLAERDDGQFEQRVAIKVIEQQQAVGLQSRFERERRILAPLSHPNIARLLGGGTTPQGAPYFIMELVEAARSIDRFCADEHLKSSRCSYPLPRLLNTFTAV